LEIFMIHPASEDCLLDPAHGVAICEEIGEGLRARLNREPVRLPPRLLGLVAQLRDDRPANAPKRIA